MKDNKNEKPYAKYKNLLKEYLFLDNNAVEKKTILNVSDIEMLSSIILDYGL